MTLSTELNARLDTSGSISGLQGNTTIALGEMDSVELPDINADISLAREQGDGIDLSAITSGVEEVVSRLTPLLESLPVVDDVIGPVSTAIDLAGQLGELDLVNGVTGLAGTIDEQLAGSSDFLSKLNDLSDLLEGNPSMQAAQNLVAGLSDLTGTNLNIDDLKTPNLLPAVQAVTMSVGGLMSLHHRLQESDRLSAVVKAQLDSQLIFSGVAQVERQLTMGSGQPLIRFIRDLDVGDAAQVELAKQAIDNLGMPVVSLRTAIAEGMAFGEATLVQLDAPRLKLALRESTIQLGQIDYAPLEQCVTRLADQLRPLFQFNIPDSQRLSLDEWLNRLEGLVADLATEIDVFDIQGLTAPVSQGIEAVMQIPQALNQALQALRLNVQQGLNSIKLVIREIPIEIISNTIKQVLAPITEALAFIGELVGRIQAALSVAVGVLQEALNTAEQAVDVVKEELENIFRLVKTYLDQLNLESVIGEVSQQIDSFAQALGQADMSPYFNSVVDAINTTADVVDAVPFDLLPDSMEQDVVNVVRPVKEVNIQEFKGEIKDLIQIGPDGKFALRPDLEEALSGIQAKFSELLEIIRQGDPAALVADINTELDKLKVKIEELTPSVALEPVQEVIDEVKATVASFDLDETLKPLNDGFDLVLEKVDEFKPSNLLAELDGELTQARDAVFGAFEFDAWGEQLTQLRDAALALLDPLDPTQLEPMLQKAVDEIQAQAANLPRLELGYMLGSLFSSVLGGSAGQLRADSFGAVLDWMQSGGGTQSLRALARNASDQVNVARDAVQEVDLQAIILRLQPSLVELRNAIESLPDGEAKTRLLKTSISLDIETPLRDFTVYRERYLASLQLASNEFTELANEGLSEVDIIVSRLTTSFTPLGFGRDLLSQILGVIGIGSLDGGLQQLVNNTFQVATPARVAGILTPLFTALKGRVQALLDGFFNPVLDAIGDLEAVKEQLSLAGLMAELDEVHAEAKSQVELLHPNTVLGETVAAFNATQTQVLAFDPLGAINDALTMLRDSSVRVLGKLDAEEILKTPIEIYRDLLSALEALDIEQLLTPILDVLDTLSERVGQGLDDTAESFERLQNALPDQVGSTTFSASASVST